MQIGLPSTDDESLHALILESAQDALAIMGEGCDIRFISQGCRAFGYEPRELLGDQSWSLVHPDDAALAEALITAPFKPDASPQAPQSDFRFKRKDGSWGWVEVRVAPIGRAAGRPETVLAAFRDVTARRAFEDALEASANEARDAYRTRTEALANVSHELRTPLTVILGFADLLRERDDLAPQARSQCDHIATAGRSLLGLVNDLLDFSRIEAGRLRIEAKPCAVAEVCATVVDLMGGQAGFAGVSLLYDRGDGTPDAALLDESRLRQVLLNLVSNALKFAPGGRVTLRTRGAPTGDRLRFEVSDTGVGIPSDSVSSLFQRYAQIDAAGGRIEGGHGLGLAISKGLIEAMGGRIGLESVEGDGSTFWFELPLQLAAEASVASATGDKPDLSGLRLLAIDDNPTHLEIVSSIAESAGMLVTTAQSGVDGALAAAREPFDVILVDLRMPGMDGNATARKIRETTPLNAATPMLAFSADVSRRAAVFDGHVEKPLIATTLLQRLADATAFMHPTAA